MPPKPQADTELKIAAPDEQRVIVRIEGTSPLLTNRLAEDALAALTNPTPGKRTGPRIFKDPEEIWRSHLHVIHAEEQRYGIPGASVHSAMIAAGRFIPGVHMTQLRGVFRVPFGLLEILGPPPVQHFAMGRPQANGPVMPIYRPEFREWSVDVPVSFDARLITLESLVNLIERAGYSVGIGAFRPECNGCFGTFRVARHP